MQNFVFTAKFKRCFYEMSKELFNVETKPTQMGIRQYIDIVAFFAIFRVLQVVYVMYVDYQVDNLWFYDFRKHDILVSFLYTFRETLDYTTFLMVYFFVLIYFILAYWCFRLDVSGRNWRFWYQITVLSLNQHHQFRLSGNRLAQVKAQKSAQLEERFGRFPLAQLLLQSDLGKMVSGALTSMEIAARLEDVDVPAVQARPLPLMPFLSWKVRAKALRLMLLTEAFAYVSQVGIVIIFFTAMVAFAYIYPHWDRHPWYIIIWEIHEMLWPLVFIVLIIRYAFFFTTLIILSTIVFTSHVIEWQNKVKGWLKQFGSPIMGVRKRLAFPVSGRLLLERFLREHNFVCYLVVSCSGQFWGKIILATICTQIPVNVFFVRKIFVAGNEEAMHWLKLIFILICSIQLSIFAVIFIPLGWCQKVYHSPKKFIPSFILLSTGSGAWWWTLRLKYNDLYGRLMRGPKFALSVGELHAITYFSAVEFLFSYIAYLLMAFSPKKVIHQ